MTDSLTAFARVQDQWGGYLYCWELKSVNHRYLDISFRLPDAYRCMENTLRYQLRDHLHRGKIDCQLKISDATDTAPPAMQMNAGLVDALLEVSAALAARYPLANDVTVNSLLTWPGVLQQSQPEMHTLQPQLERLFNEALEQLLIARHTEGNGLKIYIQSRIDLLKEEIRLARSLVALISQQTREKLMAKLHQLQLGVLESRIEQEIALILIRLDVTEELDRLQTHLTEVARIIECDTVVGKRLDFLMQELNREANTLSAKSDSAALTQHAVQMKVLIEQMREQIQNIE